MRILPSLILVALFTFQVVLTEASTLASWVEAKDNPGKVSLLGYVTIKGKRLEFQSATGDDKQVYLLIQTFENPATEELLRNNAGRFDGVIPVLANGQFSKRPVVGKQGNSRVTTGRYSGPFYDFKIDDAKILTRAVALEKANILMGPENLKIYSRKIKPIAFKNLNLFVDTFEIKTYSKYVDNQKQVNHSLKVMAKLSHPNDVKTYLNATAKISDSKGDLKATRNITKYDKTPVNAVIQKAFWFQLDRKPDGDLKVEITFEAKDKGQDKETSTHQYMIPNTGLR